MSQPKQQPATEQAPKAKSSTTAPKELTETELDEVSGGIIFVGGAPRRDFEPNG